MSAVLHTSQQAEQSVLGTLLSWDSTFQLVAGTLQAKHFAVAGHGSIWTAMETLTKRKQGIDVVSVFDVLQQQGVAEQCGGLAYLQELATSSTGKAAVVRHAGLIVEKFAARELVMAAEEAVEIASGEGEPAEKIDQITTLFGGLQRAQVQKMPRRIAEIALERIDHYNALADGKVVSGWRTHIPWLTNELNGGFRPGGLYVLAARPSVGKSSFAQELGLNFAADDLPTLFLSQEMSEGEIADRSVANTGRLSYGALLTGKMDREHWSRAVEAMDRLGNLPLYVDEQGSLTLRDIRAKAKAVPGLKVLILDYLQLCDYQAGKGTTTNDALAVVSKGLKGLAKELGIAIVALSQLNREVEKRADKRPNESDLRDSGAIEQDADVILFLWPVRDAGEGRKVVGLGLGKNRQGKRGGQVGLDFFGDVQRWTQSTEDINQQAATGRKGAFE